MLFFSWLRNRTSIPSPRGRAQQRPTPPRFRPRLEALEDRTLPSTYYAATASDLIADINAANKAGGTNTINLAANTTFDLTAVNNNTNGANGLPVISGGGGKKGPGADNLTILGNGDTIERLSGSSTFRLFDVASGASLTLENVTLQGGLAFGSGAAADGGAIYNQGTLILSNTIVQNNTAQGSNGLASGVSISKKNNLNNLIPPQPGAAAEGGGIWTNGTVTLEAGTLIGSTNGYDPRYGQGNKALGGRGGTGYGFGTQGVNGGAGGGGFGGGLYQAGGSVTVSNATLAGNMAAGGVGGSAYAQRSFSGNGGAASGGGLYMASGTLVMKNNDAVKTNLAMGGNGGIFSGLSARGGTGGTGSGGGIYIGGGTVTLQAVTLSSNHAWGGDGGELHLTEGVTQSYWDYVHGLGGSGLGGGLYVGGGTVTMTGTTVTGNEAYAGISGVLGDPNGSRGVAAGAGIYIASAATVSLDSSTVTNTTQNYDYYWNGAYYTPTENDIDGRYSLV